MTEPTTLQQVWRDLRTLAQMVRAPDRRLPLAERLDAFYRRQADDYDHFRARLLPGRRELVARLPLEAGGIWVDLGGGTASNLDLAATRIHALSRVVVVDLCEPLLAVARRRLSARGWRHVHLVRADATAPPVRDGSASVVTCSYSLTMIPNWEAALAATRRLLAPGGVIGVVDFHVPRDLPGRTNSRRWWDERLWPWWFRHTHVHLSPAHLPALERAFEPVWVYEGRASLPYLPGSQVPYYLLIARALPGRLDHDLAACGAAS